MSIQVRPYEEGDEDQIVSLLNTVYGSWPRFDISCESIQHWKWKYNHSQSNIITVALDGQKIVGTMSTLPLNLKLFNQMTKTGIGCDVAVHSDYRRQGIRNKLLELATTMRQDAGMDFIYNITRNPLSIRIQRRDDRFRSFPLDLTYFVKIDDVSKHLERQKIDNKFTVNLGFNLLKQVNSIRKMVPSKIDDRAELEKVTRFDERINRFSMKVNATHKFLIERSRDYLNWRYCDSRGGDYHVAIATDIDEIMGYCVSRVNLYDVIYPTGFIVDLMTLQGERDVAYLLVEEAVTYLTSKNANICLYLGDISTPYIDALQHHDFIKVPANLYPTPQVSYTPLNPESSVTELKKNPEKLSHFSFGDLDAI